MDSCRVRRSRSRTPPFCRDAVLQEASRTISEFSPEAVAVAARAVRRGGAVRPGLPAGLRGGGGRTAGGDAPARAEDAARGGNRLPPTAAAQAAAAPLGGGRVDAESLKASFSVLPQRPAATTAAPGTGNEVIRGTAAGTPPGNPSAGRRGDGRKWRCPPSSSPSCLPCG
ncbi:unnamed protein product, partial [Prorocentrum cordatum]